MAPRSPRITAPTYLKPATRRWWREVVTTWELDEHHVRILTLAAEAWDRAQDARETIAKAGAYYLDRFGQPKSHPAVAVERDARGQFARLVRELDLDVTVATDIRPPQLRSIRGGKG